MRLYLLLTTICLSCTEVTNGELIPIDAPPEKYVCLRNPCGLDKPQLEEFSEICLPSDTCRLYFCGTDNLLQVCNN